jgi:hypothetical protein
MLDLRKFFIKIRNLSIRRLELPRKVYEQRIYNNIDKLLKTVRKGDVVLVEGSSEISRIIKFFTNSYWSHSTFYVGDELVKPGSPYREKYKNMFGIDADHLVIEASGSEGVIAVPLRKYQNHNIRICRPYGILPEDLKRVVNDVISNIGKHYDNLNIIDIGLMLIPFHFNPFKKRAIKACLGSCNEFQVICSGMIAKSFQSVGYPIVPALEPLAKTNQLLQDNPYGSKLIMRHYSQIMPRDFDISPNFEVIKFNIIGSENFDYKFLWKDTGIDKN